MMVKAIEFYLARLFTVSTAVLGLAEIVRVRTDLVGSNAICELYPNGQKVAFERGHEGWIK
jgi:hypothetical protein